MQDFPLAALPQGFIAALSRNIAAMRRFNSLSQDEQILIIERARKVNSREEMERLVGSI